MEKPSRFEQLETWQEAHRLALLVYQFTKGFPADERFSLVSQMRRAVVSIPANVAEGFKRRGIGDKLHFYNISEGSLEELKYYFVLSNDLGYLASAQELTQQAETVGRLLNGLIGSTKNRR